MKTLKITAILLFAILNGANSFAQVSGYMGKRTIISAQGTFSGSIKYTKTIYLKYGGNFEFIITNKSSIGFGYMYYKTKFPSSIKSTKLNFKNNNLFHMSSQMYSIDYYIYRKGNLAPLGLFTKISLFILYNNSSDYNDTLMHSSLNPDGLNPPSISEKSYFNFGPAFLFGHKRIIANRYTISAGARFALPLKLPINFNNYGEKNNLSIKYYGKKEDFFSNFTSLYLSVGILL